VDLQGRLFFTPAQRAQLEAARAQKDRSAPAAVTEGEATPAPPAPEVVTYGGIVRRDDGKSTVWLNDKAISSRQNAASAGISGVRADGAISIKPPQAERRVALKVGQSLEVVSGVIEEPYARRVTRITRVTPEAKPPAASIAPESKPATRRSRDDADDERDSQKSTSARGGGK
jgi:hypothetical protein